MCVCVSTFESRATVSVYFESLVVYLYKIEPFGFPQRVVIHSL